jgi:hypothetical protein
MFFLGKDMKKILVLLFGVLLLTSFVFAEDKLNPEEYVKQLRDALQEEKINLSVVKDEGIVEETELPEFLKFNDKIETVEGLIIYLAFFVIILLILYSIFGFFSEKSGVKVILALSVTLLTTLFGGLQTVIDSYFKINLLEINYKLVARGLFWGVIGFSGITLLKGLFHKMTQDLKKDQSWIKGLKMYQLISERMAKK